MNRLTDWLKRALLLWFFPSLFLWTGLGVFVHLKQEEALVQARKALTEQLEEVARRSDEKTFIESSFPAAFSRLFTVPASSPAFFEIADDLRGNYPPGLIKLLGCDAEVRLTGDQELNNQVFRQVFDFLTSSNMARKLPDDGENKDFFRWFADAKGDMGRLAINRPGTFIPLYVPRGSPTTYARGVLLLKNPAPRPGYLTHLMLLVYRSPVWPDFILKTLVKGALTSGHSVGYWNSASSHDLPASLPMTGDEFLRLTRSQVTPDFTVGPLLINTMRLEGQTLLVGTMKSSATWNLFLVVGFAGFAVFSIRLLVLLFRQGEAESGFPLSLEGKLPLLFLLGIMVPAAIAAGLAQLSVREQEREIEAAQQQTSFRALEELERGFAAFCRDLEVRFHHLEDEYRRDSRALLKIRRFVDHLLDACLMEDGYLYAANGDLIQAWHQDFSCQDTRLLKMPPARRMAVMEKWLAAGSKVSSLAEYFQAPGSDLELLIRPTRAKDAQIHKALGILAKSLCREENRRNGIASPDLQALAEQAVQGMFASELSGFFDLIREKIRSLAFFSIRNGEGFYFPSFLTNRQGAVDYFWLLGFPQEILEEDYFRSSAPGAEHATLLAIPSPGCPEAVGFPEDDRYLDLVPVVKRMQCTLSQTWSGRLPIRGQPCEVVVRRLPLIRQHYLARVLPVAALEGQLQPIRRRAVLFWLGSVLFGACLVLLLGNRLLRPMRLLEAGIQGIREKRFDTPLPVLSQDELGQLSREFNRTLAHLADMEVASVLQSHLQPIERMTMAGFEIIGRNRMMQAIGGDYFDYFPVGERHLAFILGDVSGHGVSAALVTVMAKAGFTILFSRPENTPQTVMRIVHEVLLETLNKKKMMTCITGLLEPATGAVLLVNAGQCSPLLISVSEKVEFLEMNASPLGIMKKTRLATLHLNLRQKTLLLYSDCLVESRDERDNPVGYPAFQEIIVRLARQSPAWGPDDLFREVRAITGAIPWDDDATVVIIREIPNLPDA